MQRQPARVNSDFAIRVPISDLQLYNPVVETRSQNRHILRQCCEAGWLQPALYNLLNTVRSQRELESVPERAGAGCIHKGVYALSRGREYDQVAADKAAVAG